MLNYYRNLFIKGLDRDHNKTFYKQKQNCRFAVFTSS